MLSKLGIYFDYWKRAASIYNVHSPILFDILELWYYPKHRYYAFGLMDVVKEKVLSDKSQIQIIRSESLQQQSVTFSNHVISSSCNSRELQFLFRLVNYWKATSILELGTCAGFSTIAMALVSTHSTVHTCEANPTLIQKNKHLFNLLKLNHISIFEGLFKNTLPQLCKTHKYDFVFVDGHHDGAATISYVKLILESLHDKAIVIIDDIHSSTDMLKAWKDISLYSDWNASIELEEWGILIKNADIVQTQHHVIAPYWSKPWKSGFFH